MINTKQKGLGDLAKEAGWKHPVILTSGVLELIEMAVNNKKHCNDFTGVLWDILYMGARGPGKVEGDLKSYKVIITGTGRQKYHQLFAQVGPMDIDNPSPVITIMLPEDY